MKIGLFTATFLDMPLEDVFKMAAGLGYQAVEMPAFSNNPHLDIEEIVKGDNAAELKKMLKSYGLIISALANHPGGQIVLGPFGKDTDAICPIRVNRQKLKLLAYGLSEHYRQIFELTRLNDAIGIYASETEALAAA